MNVAQAFYHYKRLGEALERIPSAANILSIDIMSDGASIHLEGNVKDVMRQDTYEVSCLVDGTRIFHTEDKDGNIAPF